MTQLSRYRASFFIALFFIAGIAQATTTANSDTIAKQLAQRYHISIFFYYVPALSWRIQYLHADPSDEKTLQTYMMRFNQAFSCYTPLLIKKIQLKGVIILKYVRLNDQPRAAIPDYHQEYLIYDFIQGFGNATYQKHVIHHEIYHMLEEAIHGNGYYYDPTWAHFNSPNFRYGSGGASMQAGHLSIFNHPALGFVNHYAMSGLEEDKAEIFAALMVPEERQQLANWIKQGDYVLKQKRDYMRAFIQSLDPNMRI